MPGAGNRKAAENLNERNWGEHSKNKHSDDFITINLILKKNNELCPLGEFCGIELYINEASKNCVFLNL